MKYKYKIINVFTNKVRYIYVQEHIKNKLDVSWSLEEIQTRWRWPWDENNKRKSFDRCKEWLQKNHPELLL